MRSPQKFDETFKREAVANWLSSGKPARLIAEELGIKPDRLYTWKKPFGPADAGRRAGLASDSPGIAIGGSSGVAQC